MKNRKKLFQKIKEQLKLGGASAGELCAELLRLERCTSEGLQNYLFMLKQENETKNQ